MLSTLVRGLRHYSVIHTYPSYPAANAVTARLPSLHEALVHDAKTVAAQATLAKAAQASSSPSFERRRRAVALLTSYAAGVMSVYAYSYLKLALL